MIIQGSNNSLVVEFDIPIEDIPALVITLWCDAPGYSKEPLKVWKKSGIEVKDKIALCPLTEEETIALPDKRLVLEAKGLDEDGNTIFWDAFETCVKHRRDRIIRLTQTEG